MNGNNSKFNWQVRAAVLSVFLLGFAAGALALNAYHVWFGAVSTPPPTRQQRYQRIFDDLVRLAAFYIGNEADAAGIAVVQGVVEARRQRHADPG